MFQLRRMSVRLTENPLPEEGMSRIKTRSRTPAWTIDDAFILSLASGAMELPSFLDRAVRWIAEIEAADACAIFLTHETDGVLELVASHGFKNSSRCVSPVSPGDGLIGKASQGSRTLSVAYRSDGLPEGKGADLPPGMAGHFTLAAATPIEHADVRVGVLLVCRRNATGFTRAQLVMLRELGIRLDMAIAMVNAAVRRAQKTRSSNAGPLVNGMYRGQAVSTGMALAHARVLSRQPAARVLEHWRQSDIRHDGGIDAREILDRTARQIEAEQVALAERLPEAAAMIFESHLMILRDNNFAERINQGMAAGMALGRAIAEAAASFIAIFEGSKHEYVREKARDIEDLALRLFRAFESGAEAEMHVPETHVVIAHELLPSDILWIAQRNVKGIVLVSGGGTAHVSLLVRSLGIPMVIVSDHELLRIQDGTPILVDGAGGSVLVNPPENAVQLFEKRSQIETESHAKGQAMQPVTETRDGCRVRLYANINLLSEIPHALEMHAEGVGLYRTELLYLMRQDLPGEDDQEVVYRRLLRETGDLPVTFRTLDVGGDKVLAFFDSSDEQNPALGLRSTRLTLRYPEIFDRQLRAILRASSERGEVKVMFPMIGSLDEWRQARERFFRCARQVMDERGDGHHVRLGMMVELPAVVDLIEEFAAEVAFFSIGTNDFIQYTLGVDRTNERVSDYFCPHHPAVLRGLHRIVTSAGRHRVPVAICGEMAHDPRYVPFFVGIGVRELSVDPSFLPTVQATVNRYTLSEMESYARSLLRQPTIREIENRLLGS